MKYSLSDSGKVSLIDFSCTSVGRRRYIRKNVLTNFAKFTEKTPVPEFIFNKVVGLGLQHY